MATLRVSELLAFFAIYVIWGSTYLAIRHAVETIPPLMTAGVRHLVAGLIIFAWARRGKAPVSAAEWRASVVVAVLFFLIGHGTLHWAEQTVPSGVAALLVATEPLWIALLMPPAQGPRFAWQMVVGLAAGLVGVGFLVPRDMLTAGATQFWGSSAILIGAMSWALGIRYSATAPLPRDPFLRAGTTLLCGAALLLPASLLTGEMARVDLHAISARSIASLAYLDRLRIGRRLHRLLLAARAPLGDARRDAYVRQSCHRRASGVAARRRAPDAANPLGHRAHSRCGLHAQVGFRAARNGSRNLNGQSSGTRLARARSASRMVTEDGDPGLAAADLAGRPGALDETAVRRRPLPGLVGLRLRPGWRGGRFGRRSRSLSRGLGPRLRVLRGVLVETAVLVLAAGAAVARLVASGSGFGLRSDRRILLAGSALLQGQGHHPFDEALVVRAGAQALGGREIAPRQASVHAVRDQAHAVGGPLDLHLDEALEERGDVVVERRGEPLGRERPRAELPRPPPCRAFPPGRPVVDLLRHVGVVRVVRPVGGGRGAPARPATFRSSDTLHRRR